MEGLFKQTSFFYKQKPLTKQHYYAIRYICCTNTTTGWSLGGGRPGYTLIVSFGSPTNRAIQEGFWEEQKTSRASDGREVIVAPSSKGWDEPIVLAPQGAKIVSSQHSPGMHGGYQTIEVIVPITSENEVARRTS